MTRFSLQLAAAALCLTVACGGGSGSTNSTPGASGGPAAAPGAEGSSVANKINMEEIFPPGPGRELLLNNCQNCHTFVPIVVLQMDKEGWERNSLDHRDRVRTLSDEEFKTLYDYLAANFNPDRPVPTLPKELLQTWTAY
jgi:hypothetical protein